MCPCLQSIKLSISKFIYPIKRVDAKFSQLLLFFSEPQQRRPSCSSSAERPHVHHEFHHARMERVRICGRRVTATRIPSTLSQVQDRLHNKFLIFKRTTLMSSGSLATGTVSRSFSSTTALTTMRRGAGRRTRTRSGSSSAEQSTSSTFRCVPAFPSMMNRVTNEKVLSFYGN
jgi:hypothetical protein